MVITRADGVLARVEGNAYFSPFTNRSVIGRTGRDDTAFGAYLAGRPGHSVQETLDFAATLVSIKMESNGPFNGTLADVLARSAPTVGRRQRYSRHARTRARISASEQVANAITRSAPP